MSTFVIKVYEFGVGDQLYVCEDERLWDWLMADDVLLRHPDGAGVTLRVLVPVGYVFYGETLVPVESDVAMPDVSTPPAKSNLWDWGYVSASHPDVDKAKMLIISPYTYVSFIDEDEFKALGIGDDRIFEVTV